MERKNTKVWITQKRGNSKNEEVSRWKAQIHTWKLNWYVLTLTEVFLNQKRINVYEHTVKMVPFIQRPLIFFGKIFPFLFIYLWNTSKLRITLAYIQWRVFWKCSTLVGLFNGTCIISFFYMLTIGDVPNLKKFIK